MHTHARTHARTLFVIFLCYATATVLCDCNRLMRLQPSYATATVVVDVVTGRQYW